VAHPENFAKQGGMQMKTKAALAIVLLSCILSGCAHENAQHFNVRGQSYYKSGDYQQALGYFLKYAQSEPNSWHPYNWLGWTYYSLKKYNAAIEQFNKSNRIKRDPSNYQGLGNCYYDLGNYEQALDNFKKYAKLQPKSWIPYNWLGWTYYRLKKYDEAITQLKNSNRINESWDTYQGLGESYYALGNYVEARKAILSGLEKAEDESSKSEMKFDLAYIHAAQGEYDKAHNILGKINTFGFRIESIESGIKVRGIFKGGPADLAGLKEGDILTEFNGTSLKNLTTNKFSKEILSKAKFGAKAKVRIYRNGSYRNKDIIVGLTPNLLALAMAPADFESHEKPAYRFPEPAGDGQRWAVVIGISNYKDSRIPGLRYASRDARLFYNWLISPAGGRYAPVRVKLFIDKDATLGNMRNALFVWLKQALTEDLVLIYFAGHGSPESPDSLENLFLVPYDAEYDNIATTGFPMWDIETALKRFIRAKTAIVVADACHSAGVGQSFDMARREGRGIKINPINRNFESIADIFHGTCILTASADNQYSQESRKWGGGHGVFTYFLLKGLKGDSDYNGDGRVTMGELIPYISERVRRETQSAHSTTVSGKFDPAVTIGR